MNELILIIAVILPTVTLGLWWALRPVMHVHPETAPADVPAMLFRNGVLEHASDTALAQFPITIGAHIWEDMHDILEEQYPDFPRHPLPQKDGETFVTGVAGTIQIKWQSTGAALTFHALRQATSTNPELVELEMLRKINDHLPFPVWKTDARGCVAWHNSAYGTLRNRLPAKKLGASDYVFDLPEMADGTNTIRTKLLLENTEVPEWYSVQRSPMSQGAVYHATSLSTLIRAEEAQRDFVQTLAKTFAHLSIGLAIFNRDRQLALFNPALVDLTGLSVSFLSPRPTIDSFFDALRENRRMPEPKNYKTWRQRMDDLISAAETGYFEETWSLETGQTYRVTGRPHPDGAIAFLLEDISAEISQTRNFRAELKLGQSLVDTFEDALAVFSQSGIQTFSNKAYDRLWGFESDTSFADVTIADAIKLWKEKTAPNPLWPDIEEAVLKIGPREEWSIPVFLMGKAPMHCRVVPIASGATVIRFSQQKALLADMDAALGRLVD